jgi:hypothetical protein
MDQGSQFGVVTRLSAGQPSNLGSIPKRVWGLFLSSHSVGTMDNSPMLKHPMRGADHCT